MGFGSMLKDYLNYYKISQTDFAMRLGITTKHMNEILNGNVNMSPELMLAVSLLTDIDVNLIFYVENKKSMQVYLNNNFRTEAEIKKFLNSYSLNIMSERKWITLKDKESLVQNALDLLEFLNVKNFDILNNYLDNKIMYKKKDDANLKKIYLWIKHCDKIIAEQNVNNYQRENLNDLLKELKVIRNEKFDENKLIKLFNKYGIYLAIEDALPGTKVRGCVMVRNTNPAIYMTKYLKEKSSFYFTLYHEISHIKSDFNKAKSKIFVEDEEFVKEVKADNFALNQMISKDIWDSILNDYENKDKICLENNIPLCFLYTRLAHEGYIKYSSKEYNKYKEVI